MSDAPPESLLAPNMRELLGRIRRAQRQSFMDLGVQRAREVYEAGAEVLDLPRAPLARVEWVDVPLAAGPRPARLYADTHEAVPVLLYLHGGGFTVGSPNTHDSLCRQLALRGGIAVLSLDYRLAPEHRFPAAVDDSVQALRWLAGGGAARLGLDGARLAVGGDSAGGTLAAVCALSARDEGLPLALQLLITPGTTACADTPSHRRFGDGFLIDTPLIDWFFAQYIDRAQRHDWRFAPLEAEVDGVAPAVVLLAECDPLVDEGLAYADRLRAAGVPVTLELVRGVTHDFIKMGRALPQAREALATLGTALAEPWVEGRGR